MSTTPTKKLNEFVSKNEKEDFIYNKYTELLSSDLQVRDNRSALNKSAQTFLLGKKKVESIFGITHECQSEIEIDKTYSGFCVIISIYDQLDSRPLISFSMSIYPSSVKNAEDAESYGRYKMLKSFMTKRDEILSNMYEGIRLFECVRGVRNCRIVSTKISQNFWHICLNSRIYIEYPLCIKQKNHPITISGAFYSHLKTSDLPQIKTRFDRNDFLKINKTDGDVTSNF